MTEEKKPVEIVEETLEQVSGGGSWSTYSSGDTPKFQVGQRVKAEYEEWEGYEADVSATVVGIGTITEVSKEKSGILYKEFTYKVTLDNGKKLTKVWENQIQLL